MREVRKRGRIPSYQEVATGMVYGNMHILKFPVGLRSGEECVLLTVAPD